MAVTLVPLFDSTQRATKAGNVLDYSVDPDWSGMEVWPARTNLFLAPAAPVTQNITTTAQSYAVSVVGTGSATLTGTMTGVVTEGTPVIATATAGTLTVTIAGTPDHVQVEAGAFVSPPVGYGSTAASTVTRPATVARFTSAGKIREQNCAVWLRPHLAAAGQTGWALNSYTDASNETGVLVSPTTITLRKRIGGINADAVATFTHAAVPTDIRALWSAAGMSIQVSNDKGATWSAWNDNASVTDAVIAAAFEYARNGTLQVASSAVRNMSAFIPAFDTLAEYQNYVANEANWGVIA